MSVALAWAAFALAAVPAAIGAWNLTLYRRPRPRLPAAPARVSVLIPARDEEATIAEAVRGALDSRGVDVEVVVLDDASSDRTAEIVRGLAARDPRVTLRSAPALPAGWNGKMHACAQLAALAGREVLVFVDADVRLAPDGLAAAVSELERSGAELISGVPRQDTGTWLERLVVPLIHLVLLGYLPIWRMRRTTSTAYAAGCGQLMITRRAAYRRCGGHGSIRTTRHDGVRLPRAFREAGLSTDLFDATEVARTRMYRDARGVWSGFAKNADEGMATPRAIVPWTLLLGGGHVAPPLLAAASAAGLAAPAALVPALAATALGYALRAVLAVRFRQSWLGVAAHPAGVAVVVAIQWYALARSFAGRRVAWKGRV